MKPDDIEHLNKLPAVYQWVTAAGMFFGAFTIAVGGWFWKKVAPKLPEALQPPKTAPNEAVVLSAAIADSASIGKLAHAIERLCDQLSEQNEDLDRAFARSLSRLGDIADAVERVHDVTVRLDKTVRERTIV